MESWNIWMWLLVGGAALAGTAALATWVTWVLDRTWFNPTWQAARRERLLNDPLYEEPWDASVM
jgi:hypothetical protein